MSKVNPSRELETRAEAAREAVLTIVAIFAPRTAPFHDREVSSGTGFVIRSDNTGSIILTADHVLRDFRPGDHLYVRRMVPDGVQQEGANIVHRHRAADVAILRVPALRNAPRLVFEPTVHRGDGVIAVGYANPEDLFPHNLAFKRIPDLSPGNIMETGKAVGLHQGVNISHLNLELVSMTGMSGSPILKTTGVVSMLILGDGASTTGVSYSTLLQVLKQYYKITLRRDDPNITDENMAALVGPMTMAQVIDELP